MDKASASDVQSYIRRETMVGIVVSLVLSPTVYLAGFYGQDPVQLWGAGNWLFDFLPQSFMIALMASLAPGAITLRRIARGSVMTVAGTSMLPRGLVARSLVLAVLSAAIGSGFFAAICLGFGLETLAATPALLVKTIYGGLLAAVVTPLGLRATLCAPPAVA